ncbi:hypothetical protein CALVIDRAFT_559865 [Calocera viscosa TUFC12733]|uniref:Alpha-ketoglutarate-dependent dioxygenase AlkB-like domain-containing protein n=1 Tax=Calocera viscosa (strain TUFC12733) TaxID=1330018 RepID=A0A167RSM1_CALVF|nr:hypothetical protein CALVIDRAFT_559865 [Calocera viscosa TUFC12733]
MAHVDHSEVDYARPLVSISLGHACVFLLGGATGDKMVQYHGVPRVLEGSLLAHLWDAMEGEDNGEWALFGVNVRQVFPPGMEVGGLAGAGEGPGVTPETE